MLLLAPYGRSAAKIEQSRLNAIEYIKQAANRLIFFYIAHR